MKRVKRRSFSPQEKITAVLSVWTERRTTTQMCREMSISSSLLSQWQNLAMEGMLTALSPKKPDQQALLNPRLARLIQKNLADPTARLERRLAAVQKAAKAS